MHKNKDQRKNIIGIFWENKKFSSNLYELYIQGNKKLIVYVITYGAKSTSTFLGDTDPPKG